MVHARAHTHTPIQLERVSHRPRLSSLDPAKATAVRVRPQLPAQRAVAYARRGPLGRIGLAVGPPALGCVTSPPDGHRSAAGSALALPGRRPGGIQVTVTVIHDCPPAAAAGTLAVVGPGPVPDAVRVRVGRARGDSSPTWSPSWPLSASDSAGPSRAGRGSRGRGGESLRLGLGLRRSHGVPRSTARDHDLEPGPTRPGGIRRHVRLGLRLELEIRGRGRPGRLDESDHPSLRESGPQAMPVRARRPG